MDMTIDQQVALDEALVPHTFDELSFKEEILAFLRNLGHSGEIKKITDININKLHQPWRSFAAVISKCLSGKSTELPCTFNYRSQVENSDDESNDDESHDTHVALTPVNPDGQQQSSSVSSQFVTSMFNLSPDTGIHSLFELTHRVDVPVMTTVVPLLVTAPTLPPPSIPIISQVQQAPAPTPTTAPNTSLQDLPNFGSVFGFDHHLKTLEANFSEFMQTNQFAEAVSSILGIVDRYIDHRMNEAVKIIKKQVKVQVSKILPKIEKTVNEQLEAEVLTRASNSSKTSYAVAVDLSKLELKKILIEKMESNKSIHRSDEQRNLYKALVNAYECDKIILDTYEDTVTLKRRCDDEDKDEEPSTGSDRGSKRRRAGKEPEEPLQTTQDLEEPSHQEFETGAANNQLVAEASQHPEWFQKQTKPPTPDRAWNKTLPATYESIQPWTSDLTKQAYTRTSFNELMDTFVDFSAFLMNRLKVDTLTPEFLAGPTYELMKGSCKSIVELELFLKEVYKATTDQLDWNNPEGQDDDKLYKFEEGDFRRLHIEDIEDMLLLLVQGKLTNLTVEERFAFNVSLRMFTRSIVIQRRVKDLQLGVESYQKKLNLTKPDTYRTDLKRKEAYTAYSNPRGFIYQIKDKQNRLMRIDELHKFSDDALNDVRTAPDDRLKGILMKYLPQTIYRRSDKERAAAMIQVIEKQLKTRRIMRSLEKFVGGRLYEEDFRML
nr:hypothetical protein [Tanacetum cinerariifolium]